MSCPLCESSETFLFYKAAEPQEFWRCQECEFIFVPLKFHLSSEQEKSRYQTHQNNIDDPGYQNFLMPAAEAVEKFCPAPARGLDFGCGPGPALVAMLERRGYEMKGYDPFFFPDTKLLERRYDFVTATEVLEHLREPRKVLEKLSKLADTFVIMTALLSDPDDFANWYYKNDPTHISFFSKASLRWVSNFLHAKIISVTSRLVVLERRS